MVCGRAAPDPFPAGCLLAGERSGSLTVGLLQVGTTRGSERRLVFTPHEPTGTGTVRAALVALTNTPHPNSRVCFHSVKTGKIGTYTCKTGLSPLGQKEMEIGNRKSRTLRTSVESGIIN